MNDDLQSADVGTAETASPGPEPGHFDGPVAASGGEAVDMREAQGPIYKPSGPVTQHFQTIVRKVAPVLGFVALAAGIVVGLLLAAGVINLQGIVETVRDLQPTPVAFAPAAEGESLIMGISDIACSSGSACTSASLEPSYVLKALGVEDEMAHSSLRLSLGRWTTEEEIDLAIEQITRTVEHLRSMSPLWDLHKEGVDISKIQWQAH